MAIRKHIAKLIAGKSGVGTASRRRGAFASLDEKQAYHDWLAALQARGYRDIAAWKLELGQVLEALPSGARLLAALDAIEVPKEQGLGARVSTPSDGFLPAQEEALRSLAETALEIVERSPVVGLGETTHYQIVRAADAAVLARVRGWALLFIAIVFGGAILGVWKYEGLISSAEKAKTDAVAQMNGSVTAVSTQAALLKTQAQAAQGDLDMAKTLLGSVKGVSQQLKVAQDDAAQVRTTVESARIFAHAIPGLHGDYWSDVLWWWVYFIAPILWFLFAVYLIVKLGLAGAAALYAKFSSH